MTNKEFYGDKLLAIALYKGDGCRVVHELKYGKSCYGKACCDCDIYTTEGVLEWLNAEHGEPEPPLLENGDGLKPGDWIMVKDKADNSDGWARRQFICYKDNAFWAISNDDSFDNSVCLSVIRWEQARLPREGE